MSLDDRVHRERLLRSAVLRGDDQAWRTWYDESFDDLKAYAVWRCGGRRDTAEEIVQEVWLTAVRRIRRFDPDQGPFAAWLRGIAINVLKNHRRRVAASRVEALPEEDAIAGHAGAEQERQDQAERITAALLALPERYESVLRAKYLEQKSVAEVARAWNDSVKTIESLLTRARDAFRRLYRDPGDSSPDDLPVVAAQGENSP